MIFQTEAPLAEDAVLSSLKSLGSLFTKDAAVAATEEVVATNGETAATALGKAMPKAYRANEVNKVTTFKEFVLPSGKRIDFIDIEKGIVYELKPNNPRAIKQGVKQALEYIEELKTIPRFKNINRTHVIDKY